MNWLGKRLRSASSLPLRLIALQMTPWLRTRNLPERGWRGSRRRSYFP